MNYDSKMLTRHCGQWEWKELNSDLFAITNHRLKWNCIEATHALFYPCDENQKITSNIIHKQKCRPNTDDNGSGDDKSNIKENSWI